MSSSPNPAAALSRIPGWADARATPLARGSNNAIFLVERGERRAVLKIGLAGRGFPLNTRADEAAVQGAAYAAGFAPRVLYVDAELLLEEYVAGTAWAEPEFRDAAKLAELAIVLRRLHALPPTGRHFPLHAAARRYRNTLRPGTDLQDADRWLAVVEALEPAAILCCCHNDLAAGNIISGARIVLLDWEYAGDNDPLFDLATVLEQHDLASETAGVLLEAYFGRDAGRHVAALERVRSAYAALLCLWSASR